MQISKVNIQGVEIALVDSSEVLIKDGQSALDILMTVSYESGCNRIVLDKSVICEDFFNLRTGIAGEVLQKVVNYQLKVAIVGDFSMYTSKSLADFIYESNQGRHVFFVSTTEEAIEKLSGS
ncbi:MAG: DUF4180 domain-containing protein [Firmicutes bacterium]|nr:DUF4180 domain-containing protein [Bacillota bacterium]